MWINSNFIYTRTIYVRIKYYIPKPNNSLNSNSRDGDDDNDNYLNRLQQKKLQNCFPYGPACEVYVQKDITNNKVRTSWW